MVTKTTFLDKEYLELLNCTLSEWSSPEDDEAFKHLQNDLQ